MLGRGLESLIPNNKDRENNSFFDNKKKDSFNISNIQTSIPSGISKNGSHEAVFQIEVEKIFPNPHQPRRVFNEEALNELAASIRELGIIQPLVVTKIEKETDTGTSITYQLIAGERRLRASKIVGLQRVPVVIKRVDDEKDKLEMAIVENVQRDDLNPIETARSYAKLQEDFGLTQREVAARMGKSREVVANALRLLNLPTNIQDAISNRKISDSQARLLLAVSDAKEQNDLFEDIIKNNLSVRELKEKINSNKLKKENKESYQSRINLQSGEYSIFENRLKDFLGSKVSLKKINTSGAGIISINFTSSNELHDLIKKILNSNDFFDA